MTTIGYRLRQVRGKESQAAFSSSVGLHKNTLGTYERDEREIGSKALARLAANGVNINWLLTGQGAPLCGAATKPADDKTAEAERDIVWRLALELTLAGKCNAEAAVELAAKMRRQLHIVELGERHE